jgi:hypothetical protein
MDDETIETVTDALSNIPGIGPARKTALYAAGITTRAALSQASVEQIISLTGMPRNQAEKALESLQTTESVALSTPSPQIAPPLQDEAMPGTPPPVPADETPTEIPALPDDDQNPEMAVRGMLDNAAFRTKTALADATRVWSLPKLIKPLTKLATTLDTLTEQTVSVLRPKTAARLAVRLESLSRWVEKTAANDKPPKSKQRDRVRRRLKSEHAELTEAIQSTLKKQNDTDAKAVKISLSASESPRRKKRSKSS